MTWPAGLDVLVLEQSAVLGGGSRTDELVPGYRFNTHSAAHNIINAAGIVEELGLRAAGLDYQEMDPFSSAVHGDGAIVRFHRSVEQTVESTYAFTPSALDDSLAPPNHHTVYLACPTAPFQVRGGWHAVKEESADQMIDTVAARAPGFRSTIVARTIRTPRTWWTSFAGRVRIRCPWTSALDQLGWMRPTRALSGHHTPVPGLFITGAGTAPVGGIAGTPGRAAAKAVLAWHRRHGR